jgi:hypothetical protein
MSDNQITPFTYPFQLFDHIYKFIYFPTTNWSEAFSPKFYFGSNTQDADIEKYVLSKVGSYGSQLAQLFDTLDLLIDKLPPDNLTDEEKVCIERYRRLSSHVDEAVDEYRRRSGHDITESDIGSIISGLEGLKKSNPTRYRQYMRRLRAAIAFDEMTE